MVIESSSRWRMENLSLNSLKDLQVSDIGESFKLLNVVMPKVEEIYITDTFPYSTMVHLSSIDVPNLLELKLYECKLTCFKDINAPSLEFADLNIDPCSDDTTGLIKILEKVKKLRSSNGLWSKHMPMLESLSLAECDEEECDEFEKQSFPLLKRLHSTFTYYNDEFPSLLPDTPVLEVYEAFNPPDLDRLDKLQVYQNTLKVIYIIEDHAYRTFPARSALLANVQFPLLTDLIFIAQYCPYIELRGCQFPNLKILILENESKAFGMNASELSTIEIQTPSLTKLRIKRLRLGDVFEVSGYPRLTSLAITECPDLRGVVVLKCPTLTNVKIHPHKPQHNVQVRHDGSLDGVDVEPLDCFQLDCLQLART